ncbi:hypothetical protein NDU88_000191, partial [Pleurodeles waltl]
AGCLTGDCGCLYTEPWRPLPGLEVTQETVSFIQSLTLPLVYLDSVTVSMGLCCVSRVSPCLPGSVTCLQPASLSAVSAGLGGGSRRPARTSLLSVSRVAAASLRSVSVSFFHSQVPLLAQRGQLLACCLSCRRLSHSSRLG